MIITKDEAMQTAVNFLSSQLESRLEIVDHIEGNIYHAGKINLKNSWIIHVKSEEPILDGKNQYIVIDKKTGVINEIIAG